MALETQSLCWDCSKGANECGFMRSLEPVAGWEADRVLCEGNWTYNVIRCPNFSPMRSTTGKKNFVGRTGIKVRVVETGKVYPSIRRCAEEVNISESYISSYLKGYMKPVKGLHFERV